MPVTATTVPTTSTSEPPTAPTTVGPPGGVPPSGGVPGPPAPPPAGLPAGPPTSDPTTSTIVGATPPVTGVPGVPTGGPPTTVPAAGTAVPEPAPIDVAPSVAAVNADVAQLAAISGYSKVQGDVTAAERRLAAAQGALRGAQGVRRELDRRASQASMRLVDARSHMAGLALAAYTGEAYASPGSGEASSPSGTVSTPGGVPPDLNADQTVLLSLVVQHTEAGFTEARRVLAHARAQSVRGAKAVDVAVSRVAGESQGVAAADAALDQARRAATAAGAASATAASAAEQAAVASSPSAGVVVAMSAAGSASPVPAAIPPDAPTILGPALVTAAELAAWYSSTGRAADTTVPIARLAADYLSAGRQTGVRGDLAFAQSVIETGYFAFPVGGQLTGTDNNFAGIGACDSCSHGWSFPTALIGVGAQEELLEAYATPGKVATPLIGSVGVGGCCRTWVALAGRWATSRTYGVAIMTVYKHILDWVISRRLVSAGLVAARAGHATPGTRTGGRSVSAK